MIFALFVAIALSAPAFAQAPAPPPGYTLDQPAFISAKQLATVCNGVDGTKAPRHAFCFGVMHGMLQGLAMRADPLFCPPSQGIDPDTARLTYLAYSARHPVSEQFSYAVTFVAAMQEAYPCGK